MTRLLTAVLAATSLLSTADAFGRTAGLAASGLTRLHTPALRRGAVRVRSSIEETNAEADPIRYLYSIEGVEDCMPNSRAKVIPVFPLGNMVALPNTNQWLTIFEPRYRQMYDDIMLHGGRSFAVCIVDPNTGRLSETASVFYLDEVKEVSEQTNDQIKYLCKHTAIGRCKLTKILNPTAWYSGSTYLRAEYEEMEDEDADERYPEEEQQILDLVQSVLQLQEEIGEEPRFNRAQFPDFEDGLHNDALWALSSYWQTLAKERVNHVARKAKELIQTRILEYMTESGEAKELSGQVELPPKLTRELEMLNSRMVEEAESLQPATSVPFQRMLQSTSRKHRLSVLLEVVALEQGRLNTKEALRKLFPMSAE